MTDRNPSELDKARAAIAEALGEAPDSIQATTPRWLSLMQEGVIVRLHIGRWRAKAGLTWTDLGLELDQETGSDLKEIISLGYKRLLPKDIIRELDSIDSKARKWLDAKAYRTHWGFFLPAMLLAALWHEPELAGERAGGYNAPRSTSP